MNQRCLTTQRNTFTLLMMIKKIIFLFTIVLFVLVPHTSAETGLSSSSAKPQFLNQEQMRLKENAKIFAQESKDNANELKKMREQFMQKREEFKVQMKGLRDQRKKLIVERVDKRLTTINHNAVQRMNESITKLEALLEKFSAQTTKLKLDGQNTTEVDAAITKAESSIQSAKDAVAAQDAKEYAADLTDEQRLKISYGETMSLLRKDLKVVHDTVKTAKQSVIDVARALAKLNSSDVKPSGISVTVTPATTVTPGI